MQSSNRQTTWIPYTQILAEASDNYGTVLAGAFRGGADGAH